jgi:hypothetical protein
LRKFGKLGRIAPTKPRRTAEPVEKPKNIFSKRKQKNRKKEKESNFTGRDADRPKGNGISPEGWFVRDEQSIMP